MPIPFIEEPGAYIDKLGQIIIEGAESVIDPCTDGGFMGIEHMTPRMKLYLCTVVIVGGPHGTNDRKVIHLLANIGEPVTDCCSAFTVLFVTNLERIKFVSLFPICISNHDDALVCEFLGIQNACVWGVGY